MDNEKSPKIPLQFICLYCNYICCNKKDFNKHTATQKHKRIRMDNEKSPKIPASYSCSNCNKTYKYKSGLCKHKKTCIDSEVPLIDTNYYEIIRKLNCDTIELRNCIVEQSKTIEKIMMQNTDIISKALDSNKIVNSNNNNTINNNQKFNLNLFLNEQCKDALNFNEFMENIQISYQDLENNAQLGFVAGISKIFLDNLNQLGINERPIHCTDVKRETMYIKDENKWTKEPDDSKLQKAIQSVSYKSMGKLMEWKQENPEYQDGNSEFSKRCIDMQKQSLAGSERVTYYPKVIHTLAKETTIDK